MSGKVIDLTRRRWSRMAKPAFSLTKRGGRWILAWEGAPDVAFTDLTIVQLTELAQLLTRELYEARGGEEE